MRKVDLVHTTILIIALLAGYSALQQILGLLSVLGYASDIFLSARGPDYGTVVLYLMILAMYIIICVVLIRNGRTYAAAILKNEPEVSWEDAAQLQLDRSNLIFVLLIGMGIYTIMESLPYLIKNLFELFRNKVASSLLRETKPSNQTIIVELLRITLGAFLVYAAGPITNFIEKNIASKLKSDS
jgi:hypothetical protein